MWLGLSHLSIASLPLCVCTHPINPMGIHILCCTHGNEHTRTHDAIHDTFATIMGAIALTHTQAVVTNVLFCVFNIFLKNKKILKWNCFHIMLFQCIDICTLKV